MLRVDGSGGKVRGQGGACFVKKPGVGRRVTRINDISKGDAVRGKETARDIKILDFSEVIRAGVDP